MTTLDYILDGLEAELALERELGVRVVECDRALLTERAPQAQEPVGAARTKAVPSQRTTGGVAPTGAAALSKPPHQGGAGNRTIEQSNKSNNPAILPFVFLHHRPLQGEGAEMMAKITAAMGGTAATAPVVTEAPPPPARLYVVLGGNALKKFYPTRRAAPGQWLDNERGADALVTYSPEYILRFAPGSAALRKAKGEMWTSLKAVLQRLALATPAKI